MLSIKNLSKSFTDKKVINDLTIDIKESSIFGLVGVNGAGKSTLLRMISGIYKADNGTITFDGFDTYNDENIRKQIFYVGDDNYYPFAATINSLKKFYKDFYDVDETLLNKYTALFKLDATKQISSFSKGMKRQVMLIFALSIKPKLLLLDEAFDGLDPLVRVDLKKALVDFIEDNNATIIISSHNLKELEDICDSYGILDNCNICTYGDLLESKENINKYQIAFDHEIDKKVFEEYDVLHLVKQGSVYNVVIKGNKQDVENKLRKLKPVILDVMNVNFEELFIYEQGGTK